MKIKIFITLFFAVFSYSSYAFGGGHVDVHSKILEYKGIKKIIRKTSDKWKVVSSFDREGYVLHETHAYKREMRSDYRFSYAVTDSLVEIRRLDTIDLNNDGDTLRIERHYYNSSNQCYKYSVYSSDLDDRPFLIDDFVYEDGMLISYTERGGYTKNICQYNEKKQKERRLKISGRTDSTFFTYMYNQSGQLTDVIQESHDPEVFYGDAPFWNQTRGNKIHIKYTDFDKHGNWRKSYYITEKRKILKEKRKIKYW